MNPEDISSKLKRLKTFNLAMAGLHAIQATAIAWLSSDFALPINGSYLDFDNTTQSLVLMNTELFSLPLAWLIFAFFAISATAHLIIATIYRQKYEANLALGINKARWYEYSLSASIMIVAIAMLVGIYDLGSLIMIFTLTAVMNLMGLVMEVHNQSTTKTNWLSYNIGVLAGAVPWIVIAIYFWIANSYGVGEIPTFVYWIYGSIFVFFNSFAINMILQYKKVGKWHDYLYGEKTYIVLSLVAKSALAWQVYGGTLQP